MALETESPNENLVYNGNYSNLIENGQILLLNEPLMIYTQENIDNDCAIVLDPISDENSQNLNLPEIIFDGNYFQFENVQSNNFQHDFDIHENFQYIDERQQVDDGLAVLEILCNNNSSTLDQPEFVDVSKLTETEKFITPQDNDVLSISDDDDVVFVREYKENECETTGKVTEGDVKFKKDNNGIRRNPIRKVRTRSRDLCKELLFEEDFAFLDTTSDEGDEEEKENKAPIRKSPNDTTLKQWPVNAHERPEYNTITKKIEAFDYTIREIQKKAPKKPKIETVKRKSKKKYFTRKRKPRVVEVKKIPIENLKPLVNSTTQLLKDFFISAKEARELMSEHLRNNSEMCNLENKSEILKNQTILFSIVNGLDQREVEKKLQELNFTESEAKA